MLQVLILHVHVGRIKFYIREEAIKCEISVALHLEIVFNFVSNF